MTIRTAELPLRLSVDLMTYSGDRARPIGVPPPLTAAQERRP